MDQLASQCEVPNHGYFLPECVCTPTQLSFPSLLCPLFTLSPRYPVQVLKSVVLESWKTASCFCSLPHLTSSLRILRESSQKSTTLTKIYSSRRQGFGRANTKSNSNLKAASANGASTVNSHIPPLPPLTNSPSISSSLSMDSNYSDGETKRFFNEKYAKCSVKGNFLTLAAQPKNVELGEWLAHQCKHPAVESYDWPELMERSG